MALPGLSPMVGDLSVRPEARAVSASSSEPVPSSASGPCGDRAIRTDRAAKPTRPGQPDQTREHGDATWPARLSTSQQVVVGADRGHIRPELFDADAAEPTAPPRLALQVEPSRPRVTGCFFPMSEGTRIGRFFDHLAGGHDGQHGESGVSAIRSETGLFPDHAAINSAPPFWTYCAM